MINQQLADYVKQQIQAGVSPDAVKKALSDAGWPAADIEESVKLAAPAATGPSVSSSDSVGQPTINPTVAMGGFESSPKNSTTSSSEKFFSKSASVKAEAGKDSAGVKSMLMDEEEDHPQTKKFVIVMAIMGAVILLLIGALLFVYFNLSRQLSAANAGTSGDSSQISALEQQLQQATEERDASASQMRTLEANNQDLVAELFFLTAASTTTPTTPISATIHGVLTGNASTTFILTTAHNIRVNIVNSRDAAVSAALAPLAASSDLITLTGTHLPGVADLTVTAVNGESIQAPPAAN